MWKPKTLERGRTEVIEPVHALRLAPFGHTAYEYEQPKKIPEKLVEGLMNLTACRYSGVGHR